MPNLYRTLDGQERKPGTPLPFQLADGGIVEGVWAGSAMEEKLDWWLRKAVLPFWGEMSSRREETYGV